MDFGLYLMFQNIKSDIIWQVSKISQMLFIVYV